MRCFILQWDSIKTHIPLQALFSKIHKKNKKAVAVFAYNVANIMPKLTLIFIHNFAYFRLKNYKKSSNQKIKPHFSIIHNRPKLETHWNSNVSTASCINIHNIHLKNKVQWIDRIFTIFCQLETHCNHYVSAIVRIFR